MRGVNHKIMEKARKGYFSSKLKNKEKHSIWGKHCIYGAFLLIKNFNFFGNHVNDDISKT